MTHPNKPSLEELREQLKRRIDEYFDCYLSEDGVLINDLLVLITTHTEIRVAEADRKARIDELESIPEVKTPPFVITYIEQRLATLKENRE